MTQSDKLADRFPPDFTFGVATAAYQIEGAVREDGRKPSIWDAFSHMPGRVHNGDTGNIACDHYHRWESDLDLLTSLDVAAYRFSLAWPRIIPDGRGPVNEAGLDFYDRLTDGLVARGIKVFPTLYHWDLPLALQGFGGWTDRDTADAFAEYTRVVTARLGDRIDTLATINEPWCATYLSHWLGIHAPGETSLEAALKTVHVINLAHGQAVQAARAERPAIPMGIVLNAVSLQAARDNAEDRAAVERAFQFNNGVFFGPIFAGRYDDEFMEALGHHLPLREGDLEAINQPLDWWGFNYYTPTTVTHDASASSVFPHTVNMAANQSNHRTDIGWPVDAGGMARLLRQVYARYDNLPPCYITENGACYNVGPDQEGVIDDQRRVDYLDAHLSVLANILEEDLPIKGYFAWSLMDNFEWAEGYKMRFGIVHVDYDTQARTLKKSGTWYRDLITHHRAGQSACQPI